MNFVCSSRLYKQNQQPSQIEWMKPQHLGASMEGGSSTINNHVQERRTEPRSIEQLWQMVHSLQAGQYSHMWKPWQVHDHWWSQQQQLHEIAENDHEQWIEPNQHNHQHPQMELTEIQQQIQQPNL